MEDVILRTSSAHPRLKRCSIIHVLRTPTKLVISDTVYPQLPFPIRTALANPDEPCVCLLSFLALSPLFGCRRVSTNLPMCVCVCVCVCLCES